MLPDPGQIDKPVHRPEHVVGRDMCLDRELIEQSAQGFTQAEFFNEISPFETFVQGAAKRPLRARKAFRKRTFKSAQ